MIQRKLAPPLAGVATRAETGAVPRVPRAKRALDVALASSCLVLLSPLLIAVSLAIRLASPGPVLFRQTRLGRGRSAFVLYKFRTMHAGCTDDVHREYVHQLLTAERPLTGGREGLYKLEDDERITRIGRLLRRTSIDELPQLVNVLRGDMSLVGPRPVLPWEAELIGTAHVRFQVNPGITGLWQVSGRNSLTMREGLELDVDYVHRHSLALDLAILARTVPVVLSTGGAR
jgi:lipopolysaccharide/colanic/teichoic acid biosynthesis glycosyltransferase